MATNQELAIRPVVLPSPSDGMGLNGVIDPNQTGLKASDLARTYPREVIDVSQRILETRPEASSELIQSLRQTRQILDQYQPKSKSPGADVIAWADAEHLAAQNALNALEYICELVMLGWNAQPVMDQLRGFYKTLGGQFNSSMISLDGIGRTLEQMTHAINPPLEKQSENWWTVFSRTVFFGDAQKAPGYGALAQMTNQVKYLEKFKYFKNALGAIVPIAQSVNSILIPKIKETNGRINSLLMEMSIGGDLSGAYGELSRLNSAWEASDQRALKIMADTTTQGGYRRGSVGPLLVSTSQAHGGLERLNVSAEQVDQAALRFRGLNDIVRGQYGMGKALINQRHTEYMALSGTASAILAVYGLGMAILSEGVSANADRIHDEMSRSTSQGFRRAAGLPDELEDGEMPIVDLSKKSLPSKSSF